MAAGTLADPELRALVSVIEAAKTDRRPVATPRNRQPPR
jgi:hypothetical protein